ncbi:nucleotidyltransferase family protein [Jeotgalibaca arthritidis]|uniref:Nucleotidyltransferase family protein n=1 Tax=Jeotgalibaca arthritidis TaxID=1868794 RepID=A0A6G7KB21_9LACT|nr:nucleotidyltransferase family protein [Jeotgalibaca arthritidis]QII82437.1 nucleotidyltransferase family protein [Jeotgalibaca arthritidis]
MKVVILAAGYATRLYPLTENQPKPLLKVAGKSILDHAMEKIDRVKEIDEVIIVTNDKFAGHFEEWKKAVTYSKSLTVVNDGTLTNDTRLGAIGDIQFVINQLKIDDDLMIIAGDNLFEFELADFASFFYDKASDCITTYHEANEAQLKRAGVIEIDDESRVLSFEEKPEQPKSSFCVPAFYLYRKDTLPFFQKYLEEGNNPDAPGHFVPYLIKHKAVHAFQFQGKRYDIGTLESYEAVQKIFEK